LLQKIYLKWSYKFETSDPLKALALRLHAAVPALLPLLETISKIYNENAVKGCQRFLLKLCGVSRTPLFWLKTKWRLCSTPIPSTSPTLLLATFFFVPRDESGFERDTSYRGTETSTYEFKIAGQKQGEYARTRRLCVHV